MLPPEGALKVLTRRCCCRQSARSAARPAAYPPAASGFGSSYPSFLQAEHKDMDCRSRFPGARLCAPSSTTSGHHIQNSAHSGRRQRKETRSSHMWAAEVYAAKKDAILGELSHCHRRLPTWPAYTRGPSVPRAKVNHHASPEAHLPSPSCLATRPAADLPKLPHSSTSSYPRKPLLGRRPTT